MQPNVMISIGSFNAALAIALSAFGAHGLQHHLDAIQLQTFKTATDFHLWHALGIVLIGLIAQNQSVTTYTRIAWLMLIGIFLFCGSLYILSIAGIRWMGWITPFGGLSFIGAWSWLAWVTLSSSNKTEN